jgi:hypothetical protein
MAFDVSSLANYTIQNADKLIAATVLTPKTAKLIEARGNVMAGIKTSQKIGVGETDAVLQVGACGFSPSGTTKISQKSVTVGDIKIEEQLCYKDLEAKYTQKMLTAGATYDNPEDFDFYGWWVDKKIEMAGIALEKAIWLGDTASGDGQLNKFDGFIKLITGASDELNANATPYIGTVVTVAGGGITSSNAIEVLQAVVKRAPKEVKEKDDFVVFCGSDVIEAASFQLYGANKFHYKADSPDEFLIPATNIKAIAVPGLSAADGVFGMRISNMYIGTDLLSDETEVKVWYNQDEAAVRYRNAFKYGVGIAFTNETVKFIPA